jgi:hypothetical protein
MSALSIQPTYPIFTDIDGQPLEAGYVWIGTANLDPQTNPTPVYWDAALTILAPQPIRTLAGYPSNNGTPARLYVNSDYSIRVMNKNGSTVYSAPEATERISSALVTYQPPFTGGVATTVQDKLAQYVSVKDFGAVGDGVADDTNEIQAALTYAASLNGCTIFFPPGVYKCDGVLTLPGTPIGISIEGSGRDNTGQSSSRILYTGTAAVFFNLPLVDTRFISIDNISFESTNAAFTGRLVRLNVFNLSISRCNFRSANDQAFALLDISQSVGAKISTSYFRFGQYGIYGVGMTTVLFDECNIGLHGSYGIWLDGSQGVTIQSCALQQSQAVDVSNCIRAVNMQGFTVIGCWAGDAITSAGSPASAHITFSGDGLNVTGNYLNGDGFNKQTSILIVAASQGINVHGNYFSNLDFCLNLGAGIAKHVVFTGNRIRQSNNIIGGTVASGGNAMLQKFLFGEAGPDLDITGSLLLSANSGIQFGSGALLDDYEEGTFTPADVSGASLTFSNVLGTYTKIGQLVTCNIQFEYPVTADGSQARISLPFVAVNNSAPGSGSFIVNTSAGASAGQPNVAGNQSYLVIANVTAGTAFSNANASAGYFRCTLSYITTA